MKLESTIMKDMLRYTKENGMYNNFVTKFKTLLSNGGIRTEEELLKRYGNSIPYLPVLMIIKNNRYFKEDDYMNGFYEYLYKNHRNNFITLFENFLKKENIDVSYFNNVSSNFIDNNNAAYLRFEKPTHYDSQKDTAYNNLQPPAFIMNAFHWASTPQGRDFWERKNHIWVEMIKEFITTGKYKE